MATTADLVGSLDIPNLECLNAAPQHGLENAIKQGYREDAGLYLESDTDEQLLINIPFQAKCKLSSITIAGPADKGPKVVKLYANRQSMGFSDVDSVPALQTLTLSAADLEAGTAQPLMLAKFGNCNLLTLFIESNQEGGEVTKVTKIAVTGAPQDGFNVAEIKKVEDK